MSFWCALEHWCGREEDDEDDGDDDDDDLNFTTPRYLRQMHNTSYHWWQQWSQLPLPRGFFMFLRVGRAQVHIKPDCCSYQEKRPVKIGSWPHQIPVPHHCAGAFNGFHSCFEAMCKWSVALKLNPKHNIPTTHWHITSQQFHIIPLSVHLKATSLARKEVMLEDCRCISRYDKDHNLDGWCVGPMCEKTRMHSGRNGLPRGGSCWRGASGSKLRGLDMMIFRRVADQYSRWGWQKLGASP